MWVYRKKDLPQPIPYVVAKEYSPRNAGARQFCPFPTAQEAADFLEQNRGGPYHEVLVSMDRPCWLYMDVDRAIEPPLKTPAEIDQTARELGEAVLHHLQEFLREYHQIDDLSLAPGSEAVDIASASRPDKLSLHILVRIQFPNMNLLKLAISTFRGYLEQCGRADLQEAVDMQVYTPFRSYRALGMVKLGKEDYPLVPVWGSRPTVLDHLVGYYEGLSPPAKHEISHLPYKVNTQKQISKVPNPDAAEEDETPLPHGALPIQGSRPVGHYRTVYDTLLTCSAIRQLLYSNPSTALSLQNVFELTEGTVLYYVDPKSKPLCPYAKRVHKSNRLFFLYQRADARLTLCCHDEKCRAKRRQWATFTYEDTEDTLARIHSDAAADTLHSNQQTIPWAQEYDEPSMRPYTLAPLSVIRANMGVGKTVELKRYLQEHAAEAHQKVLVITYSQALARKYAAEFKDLDIDCYLTFIHQSSLRSNRLIVCLDSLHKVDMTQVQFLILDEVLSVLGHFSSDLMQHTSENLIRFEQFLCTAEHVMMLDANSDHHLTFQTVRYIEGLRDTKAQWVWNRYVRPTNRTMNLYVRETGAAQDLCPDTMAKKAVLRRLEAGERLVVPTSSKTWAKELHEMVKKRFPEKQAKLYHSEIARSVLEEDLRDPKAAWDRLDCLIYTPTISAGVSYEGEAFTGLVAYFFVGPLSPRVDVAIQMLYRVRQLSGGVMDVFINKRTDGQYPTKEGYVDQQLEESVAMYSKLMLPDLHAHNTLPGGRCLWDKDRYSYVLVRNMLLAANRSLTLFPQILKRTMEEDYHIPVRTIALTEAEDTTELPELPPNVKTVEWRPEFVPSPKNERYWEQYEGEDKELLQTVYKRIVSIAKKMYIPPEKVTSDFFEGYVLPKQTAYRFDTMLHTFRTTYEENHRRLQRMIQRLHDGGERDPNIEMREWAVRKKYILQLIVQNLLETVLEEDEYTKVKQFEDGKVSRKVVEAWVKKYLEELTATEEKHLARVLETRELPKQNLLSFANLILKRGFETSVMPTNKTRDPRSSTYDHMKLDMSKWRKLVTEHGSTLFAPDNDDDE